MFLFFFNILETSFKFTFWVFFVAFSYEERYKALETITQNLQEPTTFEDFCMQLCCPGVPTPAAGSSGSLSGNLINLFNSKTQNQFFLSNIEI
jgi:hypothetical protein